MIQGHREATMGEVPAEAQPPPKHVDDQVRDALAAQCMNAQPPTTQCDPEEIASGTPS